MEAHEILGIIQMTLWQITHFHKIKSELSRFFLQSRYLVSFFCGSRGDLVMQSAAPTQIVEKVSLGALLTSDIGIEWSCKKSFVRLTFSTPCGSFMNISLLFGFLSVWLIVDCDVSRKHLLGAFWGLLILLILAKGWQTTPQQQKALGLLTKPVLMLQNGLLCINLQLTNQQASSGNLSGLSLAF